MSLGLALRPWFSHGSPLTHELTARAADLEAMTELLARAVVPVGGEQPFTAKLSAFVITAVFRRSTRFKELAQRKDGPLPVDGILMQLGRTYLDAGKRTDAQQTFTRLVEEFPESPFTRRRAARARIRLKKT